MLRPLLGENVIGFTAVVICVACCVSEINQINILKYFSKGSAFNLVVIFFWFAFDISASSNVIMLYLCITAVKSGGMSNSISGQTNLISALNAVLGKCRSWGITLNSTRFPHNELVQIT